MLQNVLCITAAYVLTVLLHACFSVVNPIHFLLAAFLLGGHPYIGSTTRSGCMPEAKPKATKMMLHAFLGSNLLASRQWQASK